MDRRGLIRTPCSAEFRQGGNSVVIQRMGVFSSSRPILIMLLLVPLLAPAADGVAVLAVSVRGTDAHRVGYFTERLAGMLGDSIRMVPPENAEVRVALGTASFRAAVDQDTRVLGVNVPRAEVMNARAEGCRCSALLPGPDPGRQLRLLRLLQPGARRVGVLVTGEKVWFRDRLSSVARKADLALEPARVHRRDELAPVLSRLLPRVDALLALEQTGLYGPESARLVLLTSYRQRRPVIGPDRAFVRAGSLATTYSGDEHRARSIADWLKRVRDGDSLPEPDWPAHFSVTLNEPVARAYDLPVRDPQWLAAELRDQQAR